MLAPSTTARQPFAISRFASSSSSSFCVAHGNATSHAIPQGRSPSRYSQPCSSAYSLMRPRRSSLSSRTARSLSSSSPSGSWMVPPESDMVTTRAPRSISFSAQ